MPLLCLMIVSRNISLAELVIKTLHGLYGGSRFEIHRLTDMSILDTSTNPVSPVMAILDSESYQALPQLHTSILLEVHLVVIDNPTSDSDEAGPYRRLHFCTLDDFGDTARSILGETVPTEEVEEAAS